MKKIVMLSLSLLIAIGIVSACGCAKEDTAQNSAAPSQTEETTTPSPESSPSAPAAQNDNEAAESSDSNAAEELPAVSENKEVVQEANAPKVYMIKNPESNVEKLTYHLEGCKLLEGKEIGEVSWEYIQTIGFWQCPECNPPRYENYANAQ